MRIAVCNHHRKLVGGAETYLTGILPELTKAGHEVTLFHEDEVLPDEQTVCAPSHTQNWADLPPYRPDVIFNQGLISPSREYGLSDIAPVVHFAHNYHGTCISGEKTRKLPIPAACPRCFGPACLAQYLPRNCGGWNPLTMVENYRTQSGRHHAMARARIVLTASRHMQQEYRNSGMRDVRLAPLFVAPSTWRPEPHPSPLRILFAGRMTRVKGASILAEAAASIRDRLGNVAFTFAGDGPDRAHAQHLCPDASFPGWIPPQQLREIANTHQIFTMPSIWPEPFGLAGLELALPVAAFRSGGIPDWLTDGENGALAEPPTPQAFADAVVRCAHIPNARQNAHLATKRFTVARHLEILLPILEEACAS